MPRSANPDRDGGGSYRRHGWLFQADRIAIRGVGRKSAFSDANVCSGSILLKNSIAVARLSVVEKVDPLERSQIDANESGDGLRPPNSLHEKRETSFSTE
jgi:hypothetical protein